MQSGSGYGAVNILTPSEALSDASRAAQQATQSQLATATLPDDIAMVRNRRQQSDLSLVDAKSASLAKNTGTHQALIANAAALAQTPEDWDKAMQDLADKGVDGARQFIGRFSEQLKGRVANAYGAPSASSALAAMQSDSPTGAGGAQSGLADVAGGAGAGVQSGADVTDFDRKFASATPEQLQTAYQHLEKMRAAVDAVSKSPNPSAEWDKHATELGHPEWVGKYSQQQLQQIAQDIVPIDNYLRGRLLRSDAGVPDTKIPAKIDNVGGTMYAVDMSDPSHPTAKPLTPQGKSVFVGTDKDGHGIYYDPVTQKEQHGSAVLSTSRYTGRGGANSVYALKHAAWLQAHPGDTQGALDYAGSLKGKNLSPEQIQMAATTAAARELADLSLAGAPPPDAQGFITSRTQEIAADIASKANTESGGPAAPAGGIPARALAVLKDGKAHEFHVGGGTQTWQMVAGKPKRLK